MRKKAREIIPENGKLYICRNHLYKYVWKLIIRAIWKYNTMKSKVNDRASIRNEILKMVMREENKYRKAVLK